jgi:hypothetical protein
VTKRDTSSSCAVGLRILRATTRAVVKIVQNEVQGAKDGGIEGGHAPVRRCDGRQTREGTVAAGTGGAVVGDVLIGCHMGHQGCSLESC